MQRYLGIDHGDRRIGLAVSDRESGLAMPLTFIPCRSPQADAARIAEVIDEYEIDHLVVGLPLNMDGSEGDQARAARRFGDALAAAVHRPVTYYDERLSSHHADRLLDQRQELTNRKRRARRDALAAQAILQSYLDSLRSSGEHLGERGNPSDAAGRPDTPFGPAD